MHPAVEKLIVLFQHGAKMVPLVPRTVKDDGTWESMDGWGGNISPRLAALQVLGYDRELWNAEHSHVRRFGDYGHMQGPNLRFVARVISHHSVCWDDMEPDVQQALAELGWCRWTHGELVRFVAKQHPGQARLTEAIALDIATRYMQIAHCADVPDQVSTFLQGCRFDADMHATRISGQHKDFLFVAHLAVYALLKSTVRL